MSTLEKLEKGRVMGAYRDGEEMVFQELADGHFECSFSKDDLEALSEECAFLAKAVDQGRAQAVIPTLAMWNFLSQSQVVALHAEPGAKQVKVIEGASGHFEQALSAEDLLALGQDFKDLALSFCPKHIAQSELAARQQARNQASELEAATPQVARRAAMG